MKAQFKNPDDPFEYVPVKLKALVGRNKAENQESATGFYPHAGLLSTFQYLTRYPTTETNRNRLRARMYYQHFLGVDVLELAARVSDAAAVTAKYEVPTMQAAECVVCHKTLDPVAGLFQDYWRFADQGVYGKRKGGWFTDMFGAGFEGEDLPAAERWRSLQWLGERTAKDPRFAVAMVEHVYYILTGRKVLLPPKDLDDPLYAAKLRAYSEQRRADRGDRGPLRQVRVQPQDRVQGLGRLRLLPGRRAGDGGQGPDAGGRSWTTSGWCGCSRPSRSSGRSRAVFGEQWGRLTEQTGDALRRHRLEGGHRAGRPTRAGRWARSSGSCRTTWRASTWPATSPARRPSGGCSPASSRTWCPAPRPRATRRSARRSSTCTSKILGRYDAADSAEVERTFKLFAGIVSDAKEQKGLEKQESYHCRPGNRDAPGAAVADPHYTIRAWRGVVTYLLRRPEFLYE